MVYGALILLGLCFGSFANALVWRVHEQNKESRKKKPSKQYLQTLSISKGRSICPNCKHQLTFLDLIPVFSWLSLGGRCRYCREPISIQYPAVELSTAFLFVSSYIWWPASFDKTQIAIFSLWLVLIVGFMALTVYDLRWFLLPNRIMRPLGYIALLMALITIIGSSNPFATLINVLLSVTVGGGLFYLLFQVSGGKWIGGGDVKLGWLLGLVLGTPAESILMIFLAALLGSLISLPLLLTSKLKKSSTIPFGPFLIVAAYIVMLFGSSIIHWYQKLLLPLSV